MPSLDERREVAARLRDFETLRPVFKDSIICGFLDALGVGYMDWEGICNRLAELIEPEERTCRMTKKGPEFVMAGWRECSECGPVYPPCNDEIAVWALQKCPHCGARVID